jgi:NADPH2:quinone reductase
MMLQGMTVEYLLNCTFKAGPQSTPQFHGGVGLIACQWAKHLGAPSARLARRKSRLACANVAHTPSITITGLSAREEIIGAGVDVVYDPSARIHS